MNSKEQLLALIAEIEAEPELEKKYGKDWKIRDFYARRSQAAGKLCTVMHTLIRAEVKAKHRPGSIGARKAKQAAKKARRELLKLEQIIEEKICDYHPSEPKYIAAPRKPYRAIRRRRGKIKLIKVNMGTPVFTIT